jgi:hypothetical protein
MKTYLTIIFQFIILFSLSGQAFNCGHQTNKDYIEEKIKIRNNYLNQETRVADCSGLDATWSGSDQTYRLVLEYSTVYHDE